MRRASGIDDVAALRCDWRCDSTSPNALRSFFSAHKAWREDLLWIDDGRYSELLVHKSVNGYVFLNSRPRQVSYPRIRLDLCKLSLARIGLSFGA